MNLKEFDEFRLTDAVKFHDRLNPLLFTDERLNNDVKRQLLKIANDFIDYLGITDLDVKDITLSGSNAAYTYTDHSDLDLHIVVDFKNLENDEIYSELFNSKKIMYNDDHTITIHGIPVELYVQNSAEPVRSLGEYSVKNNRWIKFPSRNRANFQERSTREKFKKLVQLSELALNTDDIDTVKKLLSTIKRYRQAGLDKNGEFGPENLAVKALRSRGIIDKLYKHKNWLHSQELSLGEDYDPNGPPPGPEFKPTMPAGTVRVDVSDVYDWYKLGQHISNMKGLGKHDFGKGPPSTIFSFGSEEEEHKYIKDLEKSGLTTTDIDPVDVNQPKGMKRQKVDPTFNVTERSRSVNDNMTEASGYIPSEKEKNDWRWKSALTVDVKPDSIKQNAKKLGLGNINRTGVPPTARSNGKIK